MPKKVYKINNFHGGLNNSSDPRDVDDKEITAATNVMVDEVGRVRLSGSNATHSAQVLDNTGAGVTQVPGSGLFYFSHDRKGGEDAGDAEAETGDNYLALYDDSDVQVWVYSDTTNDWDDDKDSANNGVINFIGKTTGATARPCFFSVDGAVRVSTGEFSKYDSGSNINESGTYAAADVTLTTTESDNFDVGNYIQIDDEILYVIAKPGSEALTVRRGMFGTKDVSHSDGTDIYIVNMNQWYGYLNNNFFQTSSGVSEYTTNKWYNEIQNLRSFEELGVSLISDDSSLAGPTVSEMAINTIIFSYWTSPDGFWSGSYYLGATPVYVDGQEGPISTVGTTPVALSEEVLNIQMYVCHPVITNEAIASHPLIDDRIVGVKLYTKTYTSNEWFLLKKFDLLEGGEHGWKEYQSGNTAAGIWVDAGGGSASMDDPASLDSYARTTADITVTPGAAMGTDGHGANRTGKIRVSGFEVSPIYKTVNLNSTSAQEQEFNVVNPGPGTAPFIIEVLDENYDVLYTTQVTKSIADSGISTPHYPPEDSGYTGEDLYHSECFLNGTQILMSSGSMKNISDIIIGDSIASYSSIYKSYVSGIVTDVLIHPIGGYVNVAIIDDRLFGTPSHPILVDGKWAEIHRSGLDVLYKRMFVDVFYNLEVDGDNIFGSDHNYVANGFIVSGLGDNDILNRALPRQDIFIGTNNG